MITLPRHPVASRTRPTDTPDRPTRGHLAASGLTYSNSGAGSLLDLTFEAKPGTMTHVVGSSTTDSATLLGLLVGLYPADGGQLTLDGTVTSQLPVATARSSIVLVLQDPWIMSGTVADNITFGDPAIDDEQLATVAALACLDELAADLANGLDTTISCDDRDLLTIGQRRLIALARALLRDPAVLLLEDPFRDLTTREETLMIQAVNQAGQGRTTIVTTQRFDPAMFSTDQVLLLEDGRVQAVPPDGHRVPLPGLPPHPDPDAPPPRPRRVPPPSESPAPLAAPAEKRDAAIEWPLLEAGTDLGHGYRAASMLHRADLTETWLAWHGNSTTIVEVKVARDTVITDLARAELAIEYERARRLQHPGIARPIAAFLDDRRPFTVYERVGGHFLSQLIESTNDALRVDVAALGAAIARPLAFIHRLDFAHLAIGPDVVKLTNPGAVITDVRQARPIGAPQTCSVPAHRHGVVAPEQLAGEPASTAMDLYALGCLLFQAATGAFITTEAGPDVSDIDAHLPPPVADVVASMLAPDAEHRPTAAEVLGQLRPLVVPLEPRRSIEVLPIDGAALVAPRPSEALAPRLFPDRPADRASNPFGRSADRDRVGTIVNDPRDSLRDAAPRASLPAQRPASGVS